MSLTWRYSTKNDTRLSWLKEYYSSTEQYKYSCIFLPKFVFVSHRCIVHWSAGEDTSCFKFLVCMASQTVYCSLKQPIWVTDSRTRKYTLFVTFWKGKIGYFASNWFFSIYFSTDMKYLGLWQLKDMKLNKFLLFSF